MKIHKIIKMDNKSGYVSKTLPQFCSQWNTVYKAGIPYNPQGQEIVKHAHGSLKIQIQN